MLSVGLGGGFRVRGYEDVRKYFIMKYHALLISQAKARPALPPALHHHLFPSPKAEDTDITTLPSCSTPQGVASAEKKIIKVGDDARRTVFSCLLISQ